MSTQCNKPYLRSRYSNALTRQACVSCPSACSCDLGERSVMDQLMIKKWQQGPEGHPSQENYEKKYNCEKVFDKSGFETATCVLATNGDYDDESACNQDCKTPYNPFRTGKGRALFYLTTDMEGKIPSKTHTGICKGVVSRYDDPLKDPKLADIPLYCTPSCGVLGDPPVTSRDKCPYLYSVESAVGQPLPYRAQCFSLTSDTKLPLSSSLETRAICADNCPLDLIDNKNILTITPESPFLDPSNHCYSYTWTARGIQKFTKAKWFCFGKTSSGGVVCNDDSKCVSPNRCRDTICVQPFEGGAGDCQGTSNPCSNNKCSPGSVLTQGQSELIANFVFGGYPTWSYRSWRELVNAGFFKIKED